VLRFAPESADITENMRILDGAAADGAAVPDGRAVRS